jgi:Methyltransferase domain
VRSFYSPIPQLRGLDEGIWSRRSELAGIELDLDHQAQLVEGELAPYVTELDAPEGGAGEPGELFLANGSYEYVDAEVLYAMVRHLRPARILELGSGYSTLLMARAAEANARDGDQTALESYDPFPGPAREGLPGLRRLNPTPVQQVPIADFERLGSGDLLFVDTTHSVKLGSDVNRIVLDVLPRLRAGVIVHFHDVFLPYEYPRHFSEGLGMYWTEQYLLQAFLSLNRDYEVLLALHALARERPAALEAAVPSWRLRPGWGASFWIRRRGV